MSAVTIPADKLAELQRKAKLVDELLYILEQTRIDVFYYGYDFNITLKAIDKAIAGNVVKLKTDDYAKGADSWEARLPSYKGKITARIGRHYFYKQEQRK